MQTAEKEAITRLLVAHDAGERAAFDRLLELVYPDLRRIAARQLARLNPGDTLNTTALVHEAYLKMVDQTSVGWQDRAHFYAVSARAMRQIIIDYTRKRMRQKRGGGVVPIRLDERQIAIDQQSDRLVALNDALERLSRLNERLTHVVECRFFAGLTHEETASALGISVRTAQRDWLKARAWLRRELSPDAG